ncbi:potassium/proton antiporter [Crenalkalicoccus roseus]|uniref:potassium/proton antiporter n=1 Tax=Crenalkalicoccus roseus TaxID=1485588 RepID=UPI001305240A|nr:potassium/proton antiporter [Crenalkalicoccus roseus]
MDSIWQINAALALSALLVLAGIGSSLIARRFGAPLLLVFLVVGMLAGEDGPGGLGFDSYEFAYVIGSLALAVILFDGGLRTRLDSLRGALAPAVTLATLGVLLTAALTGLAAHLVFGLSPLQALLLGSIVASTDAAAVFFLLHTGGLRLRRRVEKTLEIESATNDPAAVFLVVLLVGLLASAGESGTPPSWGAAFAELARQALLGAAFGAGGGFAIVWVLNRANLPGGLDPAFAVSAALLVFGGTAVAGGSGFLAVYLAGLVVGNRSVRAFPAILAFHDAATWLAQIVMFLILGLLATPSRLLETALPAVAVAAFLMLVARPLAVWLCLLPFGFSRRAVAFIGWVGLRGAVSIFLAAIPTLAELPRAGLYFDVAFMVVLVSLVVQGWTLSPAARRLGVVSGRRDPDPLARIERDLPGQEALEIVGYRLRPGSPLLDPARPRPSWLRPLLVVRGGRVLEPAAAGPPRPDDHAYFLAPSGRGPEIDRLVHPPQARRRREE